MTTKRQARVAQQILETLSELVGFEVRDPRVAGVSLLDVEVDRELRYAKVYVHDLEGPDVKEEVLAGLVSAAGYLRRELALRLSLRHTPELRFIWDDTPERASTIDQLLASLDNEPVDDDE